MVSLKQLELNLEVALEEAAEIPERADVLSLWSRFEEEIDGLGRSPASRRRYFGAIGRAL